MVYNFRGFAAALVIAATVLAQATPARADNFRGQAGDDNTVPVLLDAMFLRPLGFTVVCAGFVTYLLAAPIMAITRPTDMGKPFNSLVILPSKFVFVDRLGEHPDRSDAEYAGAIK